MTSSTPTLTGLRPRARLLITALAALSIVFAQLAGFSAQPASANDWTLNRLVLEFDGTENGTLDGSAFFDSDIHTWTNEGNGNITLGNGDGDILHISCSDDLTTVDQENPTGGEITYQGQERQITEFWINSDNPGKGSPGDRSCDSLDTFPNVDQLSVAVTKTNDADGDGAFGDPETAPEANADVDFQVTIQNTGNITASVTDFDDAWPDGNSLDLLNEPSLSCNDGDYAINEDTIGAGQTITCTFTIEDYAPAAGTSLTNTVDVTIADDSQDFQASDNDTSTVNVDPERQPDVGISKTASTSQVNTDGGQFSYTITVTNDGDASSDGSMLRDEVPEPFEIVDVEVAGATGEESGSNGYCYPLGQENPDISSEETGSSDGDGVGCDVYPLDPGESFTVTITVNSPSGSSCETITNTADLYDGRFLRLAEHQNGDYQNGDYDQTPELIDTASADVSITGCGSTPTPVTFNPDIDIVKSAVSADVPSAFVDGELTVDLAAGESAEITYEYVITNTGDEGLDALALDDDKIGPLTPAFLTAVADEYASATLPVDGEVTVTATYTTTEDDFLAGSVTNIATVAGTGVDSDDEVDAQDDETVRINEVQGEFVGTPDISIVKSAIDGVEGEGDDLSVTLGEGDVQPITYEYVITNTGDDDLTDLTLVDDKIGELTTSLQDALGSGILPVDGSVTVTAVHDVDLDDFADGPLINIGTVEGTGVESGETVSDDDNERVRVTEVLGETVDQVDASDEQTLPRTGLDTGGLTGLGLLLAALGAGVLLLDRRREQRDAS